MGVPIKTLPSTEVQTNQVVTDVQLLEEAVVDNILYIRDPNDVAVLMCYGYRVVRVRLMIVRFGNRSPQKVMLFGFSEREDVLSRILKLKFYPQSSLQSPNINIAQFNQNISVLKTAIHSYV
jgi:hypothetical protein